MGHVKRHEAIEKHNALEAKVDGWSERGTDHNNVRLDWNNNNTSRENGRRSTAVL